ncbi:MAG: response regulator transcription factor [Propionibacteriaceae bacterium]|jgi:DNA-binding NarL/FixJ family response regulator|nr:response regulator transcription factor [Propionibacteriaceae bacterium]
MSEPIRVLLVDDQSLMRMGFAMVLRAEPDIKVVGEAADGRTALAQAAALKPDVVLMDVRMPGMDGIEATRRLVERAPAAKVIVLTTFDLDEYAFGALKAGASGFLLKDVRPDDLVTAIRAVAAGDAAISPRLTRRMLDLFAAELPHQGESAEPAADPLEQLTPRERDVFLAVAEGLTNAEIAAKLFVSETTVKTHVGNILTKLALRDRVHVVVWAYENGLVRPGQSTTTLG